jgi:hypothetical protein
MQSLTSHQYSVSFLFPRFWHTAHRLSGLTFFSEGGSLLIKCLSVSCGTVLSEECWPGTLHSSTFAYFTKSPSTNWILNDSWSFFFFFLCCFCILWQSILNYSESSKIASFTICSSAFSQSNKSAAVGLSSQPRPCIGCNPTLKWVWLFPCL